MGTCRWTIAARWRGILQLLFFFALPILAMAQQSGDGTTGSSDTIELTWQRIVAGLVLMLVGIILTFRGYRHFRFTMFLAGFIAGAVIVYAIFTNVEPSQGWNYSQIIYVFGCIGGGLILGSICWLAHRFTVWLLGGVAGLAIALYILAWRSGGLIRSKGGRIGLLAGAPALGIVIGLIFGRRILTPASAVVGAYISVVGLDLFARTGFTESIKKFFTTDNTVDYQLNTNLYIMLGVVGGLIILGNLYQILSYKHHKQRLIAQGRSLHEYDHDFSLMGRKPRVRPDPTYPNGRYSEPYGSSGYSSNVHGYGNAAGQGFGTNAAQGYGNPAAQGYGNTTIPATTAAPATVAGTSALNRGSGLDHEEVYTDKPTTTTATTATEPKNWNPFKRNKTGITATTTTTTALPNDEPADNRVSYSSNTALNQ